MLNRNLLFALVLWPASFAYSQSVPLDETGFTNYVATLLRKEVGESTVTVKGPLTLGLGELQANLDRIYSFCRNQNQARSCAGEVDRYVKGAVEVHKERTASPQREAVRVVVRSVRYIQAAQASVGGEGAEIQPHPFVESLVALPVIDTPRAMRMLGGKGNAQLGLTASEAYELGIANLRSRLKPLMDVAKVAGSGQIGQIVGDSYAPSRILLHDTWAPLAKAQGGTLIVSVPTTDAVLYVGEDTPAAIDALRALVNNVGARAPNALSNVLLRRSETGWTVVQ